MNTGQKKHNCSSINALPHELFVEIITRLSVKDMVRSTSVSKSWSRLISTLCIPTLTAIVYPRRNAWKQRLPHGIAWLNSVTRTRPLSLSGLCAFLPFTPSPNDLLECCNGFLLFSDRTSYCVCNPATEQYVSVPYCFSRPNINNFDASVLDPHFSLRDISNLSALVFDPHCKVVYVSRDLRGVAIHVFSLKTGRWVMRRVRPKFPISLSSSLSHHVSMDGSLYALYDDGCLLKLVVKRFSCRVLEIPKIDARGDSFGCIGMSRGCLHYAWDDHKTKMMVWILSQGHHTHEWVLKYTLDYSCFVQHPLCSDLPPDSRWFSVYVFHPTSDVLYVGNKTEIYRYDPSTKNFENVCSLRRSKCTISPGIGTHLVLHYSVNLTTLEGVNH